MIPDIAPLHTTFEGQPQTMAVRSYNVIYYFLFFLLDTITILFVLTNLVWVSIYHCFTQSLTCGTGFYSSNASEVIWKTRKLVIRDKETGV